jgi:GAF domain-containing protein
VEGWKLEHVQQLLVHYRSKEILIERQSDSLNGKRISLSTGIAGAVASTGKTIVINDADKDPDCDSILNPGIVSKQVICMAIPDNNSQVMGVIRACNKFNNAPFTSDDEKMLQYVCGNAGITLTKS